MGVAGSGKTTVGRALAASLGWRFTDADDFHPPANIAKMSAGAALDDADRAPWLAAVRAHIDARLAARDNTVLACSALKQAYREMLITDPGCVKLIHLTGPVGLLRSRLAQRRGHFATESLLDGQLGDLQPPRAALTLDISAPPDALADSIIRHFSL
jgi:gluconokinase